MTLSRWVVGPALALSLAVGWAGPPAAAVATAGPTAPVVVPAASAGCLPVPGAECGTLRVPLDRADPGGPSTTVAYALVRHRDRTRPAVGTVAPNPGGPGAGTLELAAFYTDMLAPLLGDHDLLLVDARGTGRSGPVRCGLAAVPADRTDLTEAFAACGAALGERGRAYTSAATADDLDAVRARLGIPRLDLLGDSYGTYLMTVYAQRHPGHVRSLVLSSAYPLAFDMWARPNARAAARAVLLMCRRSAGVCDGPRTLAQVARLAAVLREHPITYRLEDGGPPRLLDETALAGIVYSAGTQLGLLPAVVGAALSGDSGPLVAAAQAIQPLSGSSAAAVTPDLAAGAAVLCNDSPTLWNRHAPVQARLRQFAARRAALDPAPFYPFSTRAWTSAIVDRGDTCVRWPDRHGPVQRTGGPLPDVPVLVLSGDLDANTPTEEGRAAARQFPHARVVEVPNVAHVPERESPCPAAILTDFIRRLEVGDTTCLAAIPPVPVLPPGS